MRGAKPKKPRTPFCVINIQEFEDLLRDYSANPEAEVHMGEILRRATEIRSIRGRYLNRSVMAYSPKQAIGFLMRRVRGFDDWPAWQYIAITQEKWLEQIRLTTITCIPGVNPIMAEVEDFDFPPTMLLFPERFLEPRSIPDAQTAEKPRRKRRARELPLFLPGLEPETEKPAAEDQLHQIA